MTQVQGRAVAALVGAALGAAVALGAERLAAHDERRGQAEALWDRGIERYLRGDGEGALEDMDALLTLWDTRETALRALVERMTHQAVQLHPNDPVRVALKPHIEALSRLLEQEP